MVKGRRLFYSGWFMAKQGRNRLSPLYGVADATFDVIHVSDGKTTANNPSFNRVSSNGSRLGFKGAENLGNGVTAIFQFESNANLDKGGALDTNRDNFVGIASSWGLVVLGNATGPTRALAKPWM